jgi:hypothetical protein
MLSSTLNMLTLGATGAVAPVPGPKDDLRLVAALDADGVLV